MTDRQKKWAYGSAAAGAVVATGIATRGRSIPALHRVWTAVNPRDRARRQAMTAVLERLRNAPKGMSAAPRGSLDLRPIGSGALQLLQPTNASGKRVGPALFGPRGPGKVGKQLRQTGMIAERNVSRMVEQARAMQHRVVAGLPHIHRVGESLPGNRTPPSEPLKSISGSPGIEVHMKRVLQERKKRIVDAIVRKLQKGPLRLPGPGTTAERSRARGNPLRNPSSPGVWMAGPGQLPRRAPLRPPALYEVSRGNRH